MINWDNELIKLAALILYIINMVLFVYNYYYE